MFFTREDILKIQNALLQLSVKDSELPSAEPVTYDDTLSIVQDGKNKQIKIEDFFNQISLWKREDFINITDKYDEHYISLIEAIDLVPILQRKDGLVITFQDIEGNWEIYQFRGNITEFFNIEKWFNLYDYRNNIIQSIVPDEEDLTASTPDKTGNSLVSLKDRVYDSTSFSGKGYKILRKNIQSVNIAVTKIKVEFSPSSDGILSFSINGKETQVSVSVSVDNTTTLVADKIASKLTETMTEYEVSKDTSTITLIRKFGGSVTPSVFSASTTGVVCTVTDSIKKESRNILTPVMINQPDTIYEIRYDFDLNGETINILENCTLKFEGGSLSNGMINSNKTKINSSITSIFKNLNISGSLNASELFAEWFGVNVQNEDNAAFLNYAITTCIKTKIRRLKIGVGIFKINSIVYLGTPEREGWNIIIQVSGNNDSGFGTTFKIGENAFFYGNMENYKYGAQRAGAIFDCTFAGESKKGIGILLDYSQTYSIERCSFFNLNSGIAITGSCYYTYIKSCIFQSNEVAIHNLENSHKFYKEGQANDNIITGCFFSYNTNPVLISEGEGWHLSDSDIEGFNGTLILGNQNVATNVRIERNIHSLPWIEIGSKCVCSFQIYASGQDIQNWRCIVHGNCNDVKIICGDNINQLLRSDGVSNKFDIVALSDNANILCSPEDTLIVNGYSNKENIKGCNLLSYLDLSLKESDYIEYKGRKIAPIKNSFVNVSLHKSVKSQDGYRYLTAKSYMASSKDEEQLLFPPLYAYCKTNKWYQFVNIKRQENISIERLIDNVNNINTYLLDVCIGTKPLYNQPVMKYYDGENANSLVGQHLEVSVPNNVIKTKICDVSLEDTIYINKLNKAYKAEGDKIVVGDEFYVEYEAAGIAPMADRKYAIITFFDDFGKKLIAEFMRGTTTVYPEYRILYTNGPTISALNKLGVVELTGFVGDIKNWIEYPIKYNRKYYPTVRYSESDDDILPTLSSTDAGYIVFDNKANKNILWNGTAWVNIDGSSLNIKKSGATNARPTNVDIGFIYKDTTLNKLILWEGTKWVNLDGTELTQ